MSGLWRARNNAGISSLDRKIMRQILMGVDISEVFSPERVARTCIAFGMVPGESLDLSTGWDLSKVDGRRKAIRMVVRDKPKLLIGSPPCTMMCTWQGLNWTYI